MHKCTNQSAGVSLREYVSSTKDLSHLLLPSCVRAQALPMHPQVKTWEKLQCQPARKQHRALVKLLLLCIGVWRHVWQLLLCRCVAAVIM